MFGLCAPALIYIIFSLTQVIIDTFKGLYNTAFFKFIVMLFITLLLNMLCESGMSIISWLIVFIPFIFMSVIVTILLYVFGLDASTGALKLKCDTPNMKSNKTKQEILFIQMLIIKLTNTLILRIWICLIHQNNQIMVLLLSHMDLLIQNMNEIYIIYKHI